MADDTYWQSTRADLLLLVERLQPEDALMIVKELVRESDEEKIVPTLAALIRSQVWIDDIE